MRSSGLIELDAVLAVARHRGFRAAATELGMSRSALSHAIAALEAKLGVRLFHRTTRSVSLTEAGEQFVSGVAPALGQIREAMERAGSHRATPTGTLRINTSAGAARQMEPLVFEYLRRYFHAVYFRDPDGAIIEIATTEPGFGHDEAVLGSGFRPQPKENLIGGRDEVLTAVETWPQPVPTVTEDFALRGFHHITSISSNAERTENFFVEKVGLRLIKKTDYLDEKGGTHYYYACDDELSPGSVLTFFGLPGYSPGRLGTGLSHHFSLEVENDAALVHEHGRLKRTGVRVSDVHDALYSKLFYFSDPDGHICAISTPTQLAIDEPAGELGRKLCLPPAIEEQRIEIERNIALRPAPTPILPA